MSKTFATFSMQAQICRAFERKVNDRGQVSYLGIVRTAEPPPRNNPQAQPKLHHFEIFTYGDNGHAFVAAGVGAYVKIDGVLTSRTFKDKNGVDRLNTNMAVRSVEVVQAGQAGVQPHPGQPPAGAPAYGQPAPGYGQPPAGGYPPPPPGSQYAPPPGQPPAAYAPPPQQYAPPPGQPPASQPHGGYPPPPVGNGPPSGQWGAPPPPQTFGGQTPGLDDIPF